MRCLPLLAALTALGMLSACTGLSQRVESNIDKANTDVSGLVQDTGRTAPGVVVAPRPAVERDSGIWLGKNVVKLGSVALPSTFYEDATFDRMVASLPELAERITLRSGIPTRVSPDALRFVETGGVTAAPATPATGAPAASMGSAAQSGPVRIAYSNGTFKGLLDVAASRFGVSWKYQDGAIHFYHVDSRTFQINTLPGDSSFSATVASGATNSAGGNGGSGGGGTSQSGGLTANNSQNTGVTSRLSVYESIDNTVKALLSPYGRVMLSPATGSLTVIDTPDSLARIATYIEKENATMSRQVMINVTVLSVNLEDMEDYGINWRSVETYLRSGRSFLDMGVESEFARETGGATIVGTIRGNSRFDGTSAIIKALSIQGKVRRQTTASVVTLNNQPVPVQVAKQTSYLQSVQTSVVPNVGSTTSLTPGMVTSGFNMSILPHILTNGTVLLQFSTDISSLRELRPVEAGGVRIETPEIDTRNFLQRVAMKSNETLIISGFEQADEELKREGVGKPSNYLFGGGKKTGSTKESIVILITPTTMGT